MSAIITLEEIYSPINTRLEKVPGIICDILKTDNKLIQKATNHFFLKSGKFLRPALTLMGAKIAKSHSQKDDDSLEKALLQIAAATEIFHAATLIHDDVIDSSTLRRNHPTINAMWGPQMAVLIGDFFHDRAVSAVNEYANEDVISLFLKTAGVVCDGEIQEIQEKKNWDLKEGTYFEIVKKKTAALLACSLENGALTFGASREEAEALNNFGNYFGIAFQIVDDCLDFVGTENEFGKALGADFEEGVLTLPIIRLLDQKKAIKKELESLFSLENKSEKFKVLLAYLKESGAIDYAFEKAKEFVSKAQQELSLFPESAVKESLYQLAHYVLERNR